jgi:hypothetical protein
LYIRGPQGNFRGWTVVFKHITDNELGHFPYLKPSSLGYG